MARYTVEEYVRWEDIDAAGIINYQAYLRFFALAEAELLRSAGLNYRFLFEHLDRIGYQGWIGCEYKPATTTEAGLGWLARAGAR